MGSKTRLSSYCTKRGDNTVNLVTSRKTNARLARPITIKLVTIKIEIGETPLRYIKPLSCVPSFNSTYSLLRI